MKQNFVRILAGILLVISAFSLSAWEPSQSDKTADGKTIISVSDYPSKEGTEKSNFDARIASFEEANPDVKVEPQSFFFDLRTFYAKAEGGQLPTVYKNYFTEMPQLISSGYLGDLTEGLEKRGYDGKFNQKILDLVSSDGKVLAFPCEAYVLGLGYNVDLFEKAGLMNADGTPMQPQTWDEVVDFAVKIKEATGKPGFLFPTSGRYGGWLFTNIAWSFGVEFMKQDSDGKWLATFNTPEAVAALQYIKDLKWKYDVLPSNVLIDSSEYYRQFATGNAGMLITSGDVPREVAPYNMPLEHLGMMALPAGPERHVTLLGGNVYCLSDTATPDQIDAGIRWLETFYNFNATDEYKQNTENDINRKKEENQLIGIKSMSVWNTDTESVKFLHELIDTNVNANQNHVKLYNDFVADCPAEIQAEEPVCAQELYSILDGCIQEVLENENADCAALLENANSDFQVNYLDGLEE